MSFFRCVLLVSFISLSAALGLFFLSTVLPDSSAIRYDELRGGYAVLTTDTSIDDRTLRSILEAGLNYFGGEPVSESSLWVLLDEFDSLQKIPLDQYFSRIFYFDPRNDGYAGKLREIFIRDNQRFVYIPVKAGNWNPGLLDRKLNELLEDIPFSVAYFTVGRPLVFFFITYAVASLCLLIICFLKRKQNRTYKEIFSTCLVLIPVFSSLAFFGVSGMVCAALLFALFILLREPLYELLTSKNSKDLNFIYKEIILPYKFYWFLLPLFAAAFSILVIFLQLKLLFLLAVFAVAAAVFLFSLKILSVSHRERRRFAPVLIIKRRYPEFAFSVYMLPFAVTAFFLFFSVPFLPVSEHSNVFATVSEQDYYAHLNHQAFFSTRQMSPHNEISGISSTVFPAFFFDADGLPSMEISPGVSQTININDFPPFPLKHLMDFFHDVNSGLRTNTGLGGIGRIAEMLSLLVLLLFIIPGLFVKKKKEYSSKVSYDGLKRISEKLLEPSLQMRLMGINWNKKPLYNNRNLLRTGNEVSGKQKDA
jgi:hypothetical protein